MQRKAFDFSGKILYTGDMKKFKFLFTKTIYAIFTLALLLCAAGIAISIYRIVAGGINSPFDWIGVAIMMVACVLLGVIIVTMFFCSNYSVDKKYLSLRLGIIRTRYALENVSSVHLFEGAGKLAVYFKDGRYVAIVIERNQFDAFVKEISEKNEKIGFSYSTAEEEEEINKKK